MTRFNQTEWNKQLELKLQNSVTWQKNMATKRTKNLKGTLSTDCKVARMQNREESTRTGDTNFCAYSTLLTPTTESKAEKMVQTATMAMSVMKLRSEWINQNGYRICPSHSPIHKQALKKIKEVLCHVIFSWWCFKLAFHLLLTMSRTTNCPFTLDNASYTNGLQSAQGV